jgi:hypothetical protein
MDHRRLLLRRADPFQDLVSVRSCSSLHPWVLSNIVVRQHETTVLMFVGWNRTFSRQNDSFSE